MIYVLNRKEDIQLNEFLGYSIRFVPFEKVLYFYTLYFKFINMIHDTVELMDFQKNVTMISPKSVSSGSYLIKCFDVNQTPLYIQSPKCKSKQGIMKAGKKLYCDLVFSYEDESFLRWIEHFETYCQNKIFENRATWFDTELEMHDIENSFLPSLKNFKSGKQHILRVNIPLHLGKCALKIYNEKEEDVNTEQIVENSNLVTILEIQGIKCSSRSFQIEYEVKQMMLLNPVDLFDKCVFLTKPKSNSNSNPLDNISKPTDVKEIEETKPVEETKPTEETKTTEETKMDEEKEDLAEEEEDLEEALPEKKDLEEMEICEIDLEIPKEEDILQLKNRNEVYVEMYREAKRKARLAREFALSAYLEAKRIKNTYLLEEAFDSDEEDLESEKSLDNMNI